jgi:hypothetical protein
MDWLFLTTPAFSDCGRKQEGGLSGVGITMSKSRRLRRELEKRRLAERLQLTTAKPIQEPPPSNRPKNKERQEGNHIPAPIAPSVPRVDPNPPDSNPAEEQGNAPSPRLETFLKRWKSTIETIGVLVAILVLVVYACQLNTMRGQLSEMKNTTEATLAQVKVNESQSEISRLAQRA